VLQISVLSGRYLEASVNLNATIPKLVYLQVMQMEIFGRDVVKRALTTIGLLLAMAGHKHRLDQNQFLRPGVPRQPPIVATLDSSLT
jgi:hypothetical protein